MICDRCHGTGRLTRTTRHLGYGRFISPPCPDCMGQGIAAKAEPAVKAPKPPANNNAALKVGA